MDPVLHVQLLGTFQLRYGDRAVLTFNSTRLQSLLAFALLHRQTPISRQQLAALFWPDTSETQARTNLRNLIHQLRQALPFPDTYIASDSHSVLWLPTATYTLDVDVFERCLAMTPGKAVQREALEQAVAVCGGDLLPGCYDDWIMPIRERLRLAHLAARSAQALGSKPGGAMPTFLARLIMGEMGEEFILSSRRRQPAKLLAANYQFRFPELEAALRHEFKKNEVLT